MMIAMNECALFVWDKRPKRELGDGGGQGGDSNNKYTRLIYYICNI